MINRRVASAGRLWHATLFRRLRDLVQLELRIPLIERPRVSRHTINRYAIVPDKRTHGVASETVEFAAIQPHLSPRIQVEAIRRRHQGSELFGTSPSKESFLIRLTASTIVIGIGLMSSGRANAASVYVGLGDSITFGETDLRYVPSLGDRGYVGKFADTLASRNGGVRPDVVNLAIDGETASSFMSGMGRTPPVNGRTDIPLAMQNLNYASNPTTPQNVMFSNLVSQEKTAGNTIDKISITLGFNELAALASLPENKALAMLPGTLAAYKTNYTNVLSSIRSLEPDAHLYVLGYFNPFPADPTANPAKPIFAEGGTQLDAIIQQLAFQFGGLYVYTNAPFVGHEASLTYLAQYPANSTSPPPDSGIEPIGNVHPNDAGYAVIANQAASVPEPASTNLAGISLVLLAFGFLIKRRHRNQSR